MSENNYKNHLFVLLLIGGGGTRLWPKSTNKTPKQFLKLFKGKTLTQITAKRFKKFLPWERIFVVTVSEDYKKEILKEVPEFLEENILVEPARKNTAPAHGLGAAHIYKKDPDAVIINEYVDHIMEPKRVYLENMRAAAAAAYTGDWLLATGIRPTYPHTGMGHIKRGKKWKVFNGKTVYKLDKFVEKPSLNLAKKYTESGKYFWNAGQYVWRADTYLKALKNHAPKVGKAIDKIIEAIDTTNERSVIARQYKNMPDKTAEGKDLSVDYAVSEKADNYLTLTADYQWVDIGDWKEVWANLEKDDMGNVIIDGKIKGGEVVNIGTSDALIHTNGRLVAVVDVDNVVVVDTKNAVLIASKSKAQNVKKIVKKLRKMKKDKYL